MVQRAFWPLASVFIAFQLLLPSSEAITDIVFPHGILLGLRKAPGSTRSVLDDSSGNQSPKHNFLKPEEGPASSYNASKACNNKSGTLVPATYLLKGLAEVDHNVLEDLKDYLDQAEGNPPDCGLEKRSIWVLDPRGGCRAATLEFAANGEEAVSKITVIPVPCDCKLKYICMDVNRMKTVAAQYNIPYNRYWEPNVTLPELALPNKSGSVPAGYQLVAGMRLATAQAASSTFQSYFGFEDFRSSGSLVLNLMGNWTEAGLSGLTPVYARPGNSPAVKPRPKRGKPPGPPAVASYVDLSSGVPSLSAIVRVEGCASATAVQRLVVTTISGASYAQGVGRCTGNFAEAAPRGGFLAYVNFNTSSSSNLVTQLQFVWMVYTGTTAKPGDASIPGEKLLYQVHPRMEPVAPQPRCNESRLLAPATATPGAVQCAADGYACPSYMCCAAGSAGGNVCDVSESTCKNDGCDSASGLCDEIPWEQAYVTAFEGFPAYDAPPVFDGPLTLREPLDAAPVRSGALVYAVDRAKGKVSLEDAWRTCSELELLGLSWQLINATDAVAFESSVIMGGDFLFELNNGPAWLLGDTGDTTTCMTASWYVNVAQAQLESMRFEECTAPAARIICRAQWPGPRGMNASGEASLARQPLRPGHHELMRTHIGDGIPLSGPTCTANSRQDLYDGHNGTGVVVDSFLGALALRPLLSWSAVTPLPLAYETVSAIAVQYYNASANAATLAKPVVLGSADGLSLAGSGAGVARLEEYVMDGAGWRSLQLDVAGGERVVEVTGCRGGLLEVLVVRTSTGRLWSSPAGPGLSCSVPFRHKAPGEEAFLLAMKVVVGSYVEELELIWATRVDIPAQPSPPLLPPSPEPPRPTLAPSTGPGTNRTALSKDDGGGLGNGSAAIRPARMAPASPPAPQTEIVEVIQEDGGNVALGVGVGVGVGGCLLVLAAAVTTLLCVRGRCRIVYGAAAAVRDDTAGGARSSAAAAGAAASDDSSRGEVELADVVVGADDVRRAAEGAGTGVKKMATSPSVDDSTESGGGTTNTTNYSDTMPPMALPISMPSPMQMPLHLTHPKPGSVAGAAAFRPGGQLGERQREGASSGVYSQMNALYVGQTDGGRGPRDGAPVAAAAGPDAGGGGGGTSEHQTHAALFHRALYVQPPPHSGRGEGPGSTAASQASGDSSLAPAFGTMTGTGTGTGTRTGSSTAAAGSSSKPMKPHAGSDPSASSPPPHGGMRPEPSPLPQREGQRDRGPEAPAAQRPQLPTHGSPQYAAEELLLGRDVMVDVEDPATYLGHGTSGVVRRGLLRQPDGSWRPVAVKLLNSTAGDQATDAYNRHLRTLVQEVTILGSLCHPNIVQLLGGSLQPGASFLVEELCGRTLSHAIYDGVTPYSLELVLRWSCDIARGLAFLHPNIMHRDLKPSNVLLDERGTAKISDFGLARFKAHTTLHTRDAEVGTTCYMAPECFVSADVKVTAACDVYSLGVLVNEMVTRCRPWSGVRTAVVGFKVAVVGERPDLPPEDSDLCPQGLRQLIRDCWAQKPEDRPCSADVLSRLAALLAETSSSSTGATATTTTTTASDAAGGTAAGEPRPRMP